MAGRQQTLALNGMSLPDEAWQGATRQRGTRYACAAAHRQNTFAAKRQRAVITAARVKRFPFTELPKELRDIVIELTMPDYPDELEVSVGDWDLKGDPYFLSPLAKQGNEQLRLEILELTLPKFVLKVTSMEEAVKLRRVWLASINFGPLVQGNINPLRNGFDVVGGLLFSTQTASRSIISWAAMSISAFSALGTTGSAHLPSHRPQPATLSSHVCAGGCAASLSRCQSQRFVHELKFGQGMPGALKTNGFGMYKGRDLLKLKGLKVLYLQLFTRLWVFAGLEPSELFDSGCKAVSSWLSEEFRKRGETVEIHCG